MVEPRERRDYVVVGAGAVGGTLAFNLVRAGHRVVAVDSDAAHVAALRQRGIRLRRDVTEETVPIDAYTPNEAPVRGAAAVLLCVKGVGATERATDWIAPRLAQDGFVVCMQNGLHYQTVVDRLGVDRTVGAFVDFFADVVAPGLILDGGSGTLAVGEIDGRSSARVDGVVADLQAWGPARATRNIVGYLWSKLGFSAMLAATALADAPMADLIDRHRNVMVSLAEEVFAVAERRGIALERFDAFDPSALRGTECEQSLAIDRLVAWLRGQTKTRSGVWRDIAVHGRATEAMVRYAELVTLATTYELPCPHLALLVELLSQCEKGRRQMAEGNLELLRDRTMA